MNFFVETTIIIILLYIYWNEDVASKVSDKYVRCWIYTIITTRKVHGAVGARDGQVFAIHGRRTTY